MNSVSSNKKDKEPAYSVQDASNRIFQRVESIDEKVKRLDAEISRYKEQIKRTRPGPAQEAVKARAMKVLKQKRTYEAQRNILYSRTSSLDQVAVAAEESKDAIRTHHKERSRQLGRSFLFPFFGTCCLPHEH